MYVLGVRNTKVIVSKYCHPYQRSISKMKMKIQSILAIAYKEDNAGIVYIWCFPNQSALEAVLILLP